MAEDSETITIQLTVTAEQGSPRVPLTVGKKVSPTDLRKKTSEATKIPLSSLKLIYRGRLIADDDSKEAAAEFKLEDGSVIHCMGKPQKEASSGVSSATASVARASSSATTSLPTVSLLPPTAAAAATAPQPIGDPLRAALQKMRASSSAEDYMMGITTLKKILTNIVEHPLDEKYRLMKKQNPAYQRKLGSLTGGDEAMKAAGFEIQVKEGEEVYVMKATKEAWPNLVATKQTVESAMREVSASATSAAPAVGAPNVPMGSPDFMPPAAGMGPGLMMGGPGMDAMADQLMSDPNQLQAMLQNPMVQQMMRNDPRFSNNPMMQQAVEELANNPQMAAQMSQMMSDPVVRNQMRQMAQMQQMMQGNPMGSISNSTPSSATPGTGSTSQSQQQPSSNHGQSGASDEQMTEEEMLAEAIRRSLQDS